MTLTQLVSSPEEIEAMLLNAMVEADTGVKQFIMNLVAELGHRQYDLIVATVAAVEDILPVSQAYETYMQQYENQGDPYDLEAARARRDDMFRTIREKKTGEDFVTAMNALDELHELQTTFYIMTNYFALTLPMDERAAVGFLIQQLFEGYHGWKN